MRLRNQLLNAALCMCATATTLTGQAIMAQSLEGPAQRVIVKWKKFEPRAANGGATRVMSDMQARHGVALRSLRATASGAQVLRLERGLTREALRELIADLTRDPDVEYAEEDALLQPFATPNDPFLSQQWNYLEAAGGLNLAAAWDLSTGNGVRIAVLDTGYRPHADLNSNIVGGYDFISDTSVSNDGDGRDASALDPGDYNAAGQCGLGSPERLSSWHGTSVAGIAAGATHNGLGVAGVAFNAKVVPIRVLGRCGGFVSDLADALVWAAGGAVGGVPANPHAARVINMSLGFTGACGLTLQSAVNAARQFGAVVVAAAGNDSTDAASAAPGNCAGVVTVAASNRSGGGAFYSNFGTTVDVAAPGGDLRFGAANGVLSTRNSGLIIPGADNYVLAQGTSSAAPHVAGVAALMLSANGGLTADQVEGLLKATARPYVQPCNQCGSGIVDALAAVNGAIGTANMLQNNVPIVGLAGVTDTELRGTLVLPNGASSLRFETSGGAGNADLYVRLGAPPTTTVFSCSSTSAGNNEVCAGAPVPPGTYHVMIRGATAFNGLTIATSYTP